MNQVEKEEEFFNQPVLLIGFQSFGICFFKAIAFAEGKSYCFERGIKKHYTDNQLNNIICVFFTKFILDICIGPYIFVS